LPSISATKPLFWVLSSYRIIPNHSQGPCLLGASPTSHRHSNSKRHLNLLLHVLHNWSPDAVSSAPFLHLALSYINKPRLHHEILNPCTHFHLPSPTQQFPNQPWALVRRLRTLFLTSPPSPSHTNSLQAEQDAAAPKRAGRYNELCLLQL
jgi:hypothetical protein